MSLNLFDVITTNCLHNRMYLNCYYFLFDDAKLK
nr:MAG TPA: hypothetical protein [Caudoviricetes sp.]